MPQKWSFFACYAVARFFPFFLQDEISIIKCHILKSKAYFTYNASLLKIAVRRYDFDAICLRYLRKRKKRDVLCFSYYGGTHK